MFKKLKLCVIASALVAGMFFLPKSSEAYFFDGTCCPGVGTCVIGSYTEHDAWARLDGKRCDDPIQTLE